MIKVLFLIWSFFLPDGTGQIVIKQEPTLEQCQKDGNQLNKDSQALKDQGLVSGFTGLCDYEEVENAGVTQDKRGSI